MAEKRRFIPLAAMWRRRTPLRISMIVKGMKRHFKTANRGFRALSPSNTK